jgi:hypothetical protein
MASILQPLQDAHNNRHAQAKPFVLTARTYPAGLLHAVLLDEQLLLLADLGGELLDLLVLRVLLVVRLVLARRNLLLFFALQRIQFLQARQSAWLRSKVGRATLLLTSNTSWVKDRRIYMCVVSSGAILVCGLPWQHKPAA